MITTTVLLDTISAVKTFVSMASECDYEIDLQDKRHLVDGKSIMGIFSLDLSGPLKLIAHTDDASEFFEAIAPFKVED
jgi:phosphocarrier protein HPr